MAAGGDLAALMKVTAWGIASTTYARSASASTKPAGYLRLLALLPVLILFPCLPWYFDSISLRGSSSFFLTWLGVFKLVLLAFGRGPLDPSLSLPTFIAIASLPVNVRIRTGHHNKVGQPSSCHFFPTCTKLVALALIASAYRYKSQVNPWILPPVYCLCIYLALDLLLAFAAFLAGYLLSLDLDPQVDAPYKSASLQDFWGRRWNLMVTNILRPSVYFPVRSRFGPAAGIVATFLVSGLMHEVILNCMTLERPTGEVTLFFLVHGVCTMVEAKAKKAGWWRPLHRVVAVPMTIGFIIVTASWLFLPAFLRGGTDEKAFEELTELLRLAADGGRAVLRLLTE